MNTLHHDLEEIRQFNELRERAKELRQKALRPLKGIKLIHGDPTQRTPKWIEAKKSSDNELYEKWFTSSNEVEVSLLIKVQNHQDISLVDEENDEANAAPELKERLEKIEIEDLFPKVEEVPGSLLDAEPTVSVLQAARIMQALVSRAETVFSKSTMLCYYRIIRELYSAGDLDYTFGAARAGFGAGTSAFVTGECVRAIFAFEDAVKRTVRFLQNILQLYKRYELLDNMLKSLEIADKPDHPIYKWANRAIERMWLDCYLATSPRRGEIALFYHSSPSKRNELLLPDKEDIDLDNELLLPDKEDIDLDSVRTFFGDFIKNIAKAIDNSKDEINGAIEKIENFRLKEDPFDYRESKRIVAAKSFEFKVEDFKDVLKLCKRIHKMKDPVPNAKSNTDLNDCKDKLANHLFNSLSENTKEELQKFITNNQKKENNDQSNQVFIESLISDLNESLNKNTQRFTKFFGKNLLKNKRLKKLGKRPNLTGTDLIEDLIETIELNRLVLEEVFPDEIKKNESKLKVDRFRRSESAHLIALQIIAEALEETENSNEIFEENKIENEYDFSTIFEELIALGEEISNRIHRVVEPIKQYIKNVIRRELSVSTLSTFDPGELVFAATAFGAMTDWKPNELLTRSCELLKESLPESGRLLTKRPLHSTQRGYRLLPIGCEMTRCMAQLFQKTGFDIDPILVSRMLNIFEEKPIHIPSKKGEKWIGWNFDGSPDPNKPSIWVTAVSVLALDRIVRMLNSRINRAILKHFDVFLPEKPHVKLTLNDLIYSDIGFKEYYPEENINESDNYKNLPPISIALELMSAHLMRVTLPKKYLENKKYDSPVFSAIFYGPPGTGKTTLAEALALSSNVPVVLLSPNDLLVEGQELMEGRARDVFEALSMLTQTVIILDEFEKILGSRDEEPFEDNQNTENKTANAGEKQFWVNNLENSLNKIAGEIWAFSKKDDPKFQFLLGGMLPRLLKLYDVAKKQSLVYCLATNYLKEIDHAAKRTGRFDLKIPVYNPDPLSRAGTLLFRLNRIKKSLKDNEKEGVVSKDNNFEPGFWNVNRLRKLKEVIVHTANEPASELSGRYFKIQEGNNKTESKSEFLDYILLDSETDFTLDYKKHQKMAGLIDKKTEPNFEDFEIKERKWLIAFEESLIEQKDDLVKFLEFKSKYDESQKKFIECDGSRH